MPKVPNIVRERLKAAASRVDHPDADVLTAFTERSLPALERDIVLEHIARCGECREVLALALPATEELQLVVKPSPSWLSWPSLRWGFVTAGILLVGSFGIVQYQRHQTQALTTASNPAIHKEVAANESQPSLPVPEATIPAASPAERRDQSESNARAVLDSTHTSNPNSIAVESKEDLKIEPKRISPIHVPQGSANFAGAMGGVVRSGPAVALNQQQQFQLPTNGRALTQLTPLASDKQQAESTARSPAAPVPASSETVEVQSESVQVTDQLSQNGLDRDSVNYAESGVGKAKLPVTAPTASPEPAPNALNPLPLQTQPSLLRTYAAPLPRWTISASGSLQRSYDSGKTWQDVDVNSNPASTADELSLTVASQVPVNAKAEKDSNAKSMKPAAAQNARRQTVTLIFRAVAATGADVWAGGSSGALYHSLDAGAHWSRVIPVSSNAVLTGDIVNLQFPNAQHGTVTTSTSEVWITSDAGQSWQKQ